MKTLVVSDLDGTLLRGDARTSDFTNRTINALVQEGLCFSYATARSYHTARQVTAGLCAPIPLIVYNGAFVRDNQSGALLWERSFSPQEAHLLLEDLAAQGGEPHCLRLGGGEGALFLAGIPGDPRDAEISGFPPGRCAGPPAGGCPAAAGRPHLLSHLHRYPPKAAAPL